jgi:glycosyltransferase involved in cell wall biosynthesis
LKLALVGPVYPYRGGIAHYTTMLYRELVACGNQASLYSFKRQYPRRLFPGPTDRDPSQQRLDVECKYMLDSLNPFTWWTTAQAIRVQQPDVLLLQWWVPFFAPIWMVLAWAAHRFGIKTVFICHNVLPHEQRPLDKMLARWTLGLGDGFIVPSQDEREHLLALLPDRRVEIAPHPIYDMFAEQAMPRGEARKQLGLPQDAPVLLFFGFVREYKGLRYLLEAMPEILAELSDVRLLVVGEFWQGKQPYLDQIARLGIEQNVVIVDQYVPNEQVPLYFSAADVVVLPYTDVTQSGVVQLAFGFGVPVITTRVGGLPDVVADGKTGYLVDPGDVSGLSRAIVGFFRQDRAASFRIAIEQGWAQCGWGKVVDMTLKLVKV